MNGSVDLRSVIKPLYSRVQLHGKTILNGRSLALWWEGLTETR